MNNQYFPHEQFYTAQPAVVKKQFEPADKIYTYSSATKGADFIKLRPILNDANVNYGEGGAGSIKNRKYEYITEIKRLIQNKKEELYAEQLRQVLLNDIRLEEYNREQLRLVELQNYFKDGLFSFLGNQVKDLYVRNQAKNLLLDDSELKDLEGNINDIRNMDLINADLQDENTRIKDELFNLDVKVVAVAEELLENDDLDLTDEMREKLQQLAYQKKEQFDEDEDEDEDEEKMPADLQEKDIPDLLQEMQKIKEKGKTKTEKLTKQKQETEKQLQERKQEEEATTRIKEEMRQIEEAKIDLKTKITRQRQLNRNLLKKLLNDEAKYLNIEEYNLEAENFTKNAKREIDKLFKLDLISQEDYSILKDNFPNIKSSSAKIRPTMIQNINNLLNGYINGEIVDINRFLDAVKVPGGYRQLDKDFKTPKYNTDEFNQYKTLLTENLQSPIMKRTLEQRKELYRETTQLFKDAQSKLGLRLLPQDLPAPQIIEEEEKEEVAVLSPYEVKVLKGFDFEEEGSAPTTAPITAPTTTQRQNPPQSGTETPMTPNILRSNR